MRLTLQTDYALRVLMYLAANQHGLVTIADAAGKFGISRNHLMKVAHVLGTRGYIETVRGRSGGMRLAKPAGEINIGRLARDLENDSAFLECFPGGQGNCLITPSCRLKGLMSAALEAFYSSLDRHTLAGLTEDNSRLAGLLMDNAA